MRIEVDLCHLTDEKAIVRVIGWIDDKSIGSAFGEAKTVELAEERAIDRLSQRFNQKNQNRNLGNNHKTKGIFPESIPLA